MVVWPLAAPHFFDQDFQIVMDQLDPTEVLEFLEGSQVGAIPLTVDVFSVSDDTKANDFFCLFDNCEIDTQI